MLPYRGWETSFFPNYNGDVKAMFNFDDEAMIIGFDGGFDDVRRIRATKSTLYRIKGPSRQLDSYFKFEFPYKVSLFIPTRSVIILRKM